MERENGSILKLGVTSGTIDSITMFIQIGKVIGQQKTESTQNVYDVTLIQRVVNR